MLPDRSILRALSFSAFRDYYCNSKVTLYDEDGYATKTDAGSYWLTSRHRRTLRGIVFDPTNSVSGDYFNLWEGFSPKALQQQLSAPGATWDLMRAHIYEVICNGNRDHFNYVLPWLATGVQFPERPAGTALVLKGKEGIGKGAFARGYGSLFGKHWYHLSDAQQLTGQFNGHLEGRIVIFADEAVGTADKKAIGKLKALITEPTISIEPKFRTPFTAKNCTHLIMASNNEWVIPAGKDARRYCVLDVGDEHHDDTAYFRALDAELEAGGYGAMLLELFTMDLTDFDIFAIPKTAALLDQKILSMTPAERWWYGKLEDGWFFDTHGEWRMSMPRDALREDFAAATALGAQTRRDKQTTGHELYIFLKSMLPKGYPAPGRRIQHIRYWEFPKLDACREYFATKVMKQELVWPDEDR